MGLTDVSAQSKSEKQSLKLFDTAKFLSRIARISLSPCCKPPRSRMQIRPSDRPNPSFQIKVSTEQQRLGGKMVFCSSGSEKRQRAVLTNMGKVNCGFPNVLSCKNRLAALRIGIGAEVFAVRGQLGQGSNTCPLSAAPGVPLFTRLFFQLKQLEAAVSDPYHYTIKVAGRNLIRIIAAHQFICAALLFSQEGPLLRSG